MDKKEKNSLYRYIDGKIISITEVKDDVFATKTLGDGIAIIPDNNILIAPADGEITIITEAKHALGMKLANNVQIILHIGIDTIEMCGDGFDVLVSRGQNVKKGDILVKFDKEKIEKAGYDQTIVLVITDMGDFTDMEMDYNNDILIKFK